MKSEPFYLSRMAGFDEADIQSAIVKLPKQNQADLLTRLCEEIGPEPFVEALARQGWQIK